jgi:hypothetical protein
MTRYREEALDYHSSGRPGKIAVGGETFQLRA